MAEDNSTTIANRTKDYAGRKPLYEHVTLATLHSRLFHLTEIKDERRNLDSRLVSSYQELLLNLRATVRPNRMHALFQKEDSDEFR